MGEKMKKIKFIFGIFMFFVAVLFFVLSEMVERENSWHFILQVICGGCLLSCVLLLILDDESKGKKFLKSVREFFEHITENMLSFIKKIFGNRLYAHKSGTGFISGYQDIVSKTTPIKKIMRKKKRKKYKDMDNKEKIRFFYEMVVIQQIKKGYKFEPTLTATQIGNELITQKRLKPEKEDLFKQYNLARYHAFSEISDEVVEKIKKKVNDK